MLKIDKNDEEKKKTYAASKLLQIKGEFSGCLK